MPRDGLMPAGPAAGTTRPRLWRHRLIGRLAIVGIGLALAWLAGLVRFAAELPDPIAATARTAPHATPGQDRTDAIVVLTGGSGRIDAGLALLEAGVGQALLISGVGGSGRPPRLDSFAAATPTVAACCLTIGRARDTVGNAEEAAAWMTARDFRSLWLVTASYHMPRSLWEFRHAMPDAVILPHPILPAGFDHDRWWVDAMSLRIVISEYHKLIAGWLRRRLPTSPAPKTNPKTNPGTDPGTQP